MKTIRIHSPQNIKMLKIFESTSEEELKKYIEDNHISEEDLQKMVHKATSEEFETWGELKKYLSSIEYNMKDLRAIVGGSNLHELDADEEALPQEDNAIIILRMKDVKSGSGELTYSMIKSAMKADSTLKEKIIKALKEMGIDNMSHAPKAYLLGAYKKVAGGNEVSQDEEKNKKEKDEVIIKEDSKKCLAAAIESSPTDELFTLICAIEDSVSIILSEIKSLKNSIRKPSVDEEIAEAERLAASLG